MSITVKPNHPLAELLARKLFGIEGVPLKEQQRMKQRAIKAAVRWHKEHKNDPRSELEKDGR